MCNKNGWVFIGVENDTMMWDLISIDYTFYWTMKNAIVKTWYEKSRGTSLENDWLNADDSSAYAIMSII